MKPFVLSDIHLQGRKQKIKLVNRLDIFGMPCYYEFSSKDYLNVLFNFSSKTDLVLVDGMLNGDWFSVYESKIVPQRKNPQLERFRSQGFDVIGEVVLEAKKRKMQCYLTHRITEVDIYNAAEGYNYPHIKDEHPDWFIMPSWDKYSKTKGMNNLAVKEIREHKRRLLGEILRKYPFDGLDIDFARHTPYLPEGRAWELREEVTEFMRILREETLQIEKETGRAIMLTARVPDCLDGCKMDGLDIWQWCKENLIDSLTLGSRSFDVQVEEFREVVGEEIKLFPCYDAHHSVDGYQHPSMETIRGIFYNWWQRGADGVEVFNWYANDKDGLKELLTKYAIPQTPTGGGFAYYQTLYNEEMTGLEDCVSLSKTDKTYVIDRRGGYPWGFGYANLNATRQLPMQIEGIGSVRLFVGENIATAKNANLRLSFAEFDGEAPTVFLNGQELKLTECRSFNDIRLAADGSRHNSGFGVAVRFFDNTYQGKSCTDLYFNLQGAKTVIGYQEIKIVSKKALSLEKVELMVEAE